MKKVIMRNPEHENDIEVFIGKVLGEDRYIISVPELSYSIESDLDGNIDWGYSNLFGHESLRSDFTDQIKRYI